MHQAGPLELVEDHVLGLLDGLGQAPDHEVLVAAARDCRSKLTVCPGLFDNLMEH